jgi:hypothetical protein
MSGEQTTTYNPKLLNYALFCFKSIFVIYFVILIIEWIAEIKIRGIIPIVFFLGVFLLSLSGMINKVTYKFLGSKVVGLSAKIHGVNYLLLL